MGTSLLTNEDASYPDDPSDPSRKRHQQDHDAIHSYTNGHDTATDPHGDRAYTDAQILAANTNAPTIAQVQAIASKITLNTVTANYTLALADAWKQVAVNASGPVAVTIPAAANVGFPDGTVIVVAWVGAGSVSITGAAGVTIAGLAALSSAHLLAGQFAKVVLHKQSGDSWIATGEFALSASAVLPVPAGTPTVGQVPVVSTASPLALAWGAGGGGGGSLYVGQLRGLTSTGAAQSTAIDPAGTAIPLGQPGRVVGVDVASHVNALTIPTGLNGDYVVIAKAKVGASSGSVSLANLLNGLTPSGGGVVGTGGRARFNVGSAGGYAGADFVARTFGNITAADVDITADFYMSGETYPLITARANANTLNGNTMYQLAVNGSGTTLVLQKIVGGTVTTLGSYAFAMPVNTLGKIRFSVVGTALKAWIQTGTTPFGATPVISVTDSSITAAGYPGLNVGGGGAASSGAYVEIDNLLVTNGAGTPTTLINDTFDGGAPSLDQKVLSITVNGTPVESMTSAAAAPRMQNIAYLTLNVGDYVGLQASGVTAYTVEALVGNDVSLTLVKQ